MKAKCKVSENNLLAADALQAALKDSWAPIRINAMRAICEIDTPGAVDKRALIQALEDPVWNVRWLADISLRDSLDKKELLTVLLSSSPECASQLPDWLNAVQSLGDYAQNGIEALLDVRERFNGQEVFTYELSNSFMKN